jgi:hypothetical protein
MGGFSVAEAALAGFRFVRGHLRAVATWAAAYTALTFIATGIFVATLGPTVMRWQAESETVAPDATLARLVLVVVLASVFCITFYAVVYAMMARAVLRPEDDRSAYLRLGSDEVRQGLLILLAAAVATPVCLGVGIVDVGLAVGFKAAGMDAVGTFVAPLAGVCALIYLAVRLSLASPLTFDRKKVDLFGSWSLTRGRFWPLFGCYALTFVLVLLLILLIAFIVVPIGLVAGAPAGGQPDTSSLAAYFTPVRIVTLVVQSVVAAIIWPIALMPAAYVYRQLRANEALTSPGA